MNTGPFQTPHILACEVLLRESPRKVRISRFEVFQLNHTREMQKGPFLRPLIRQGLELINALKRVAPYESI